MKNMSQAEFLEYLSKEVAAVGGQTLYAVKVGISKQYLNDILKGRKEPGMKLLKAIGYKKIVTYEPTRGITLLAPDAAKAAAGSS
jgi:transcriptional regulator with XRE-family HTH domain